MRHHRLRHDLARVVEMPHVPFVRIFIAHTRKIGTGSLRSPEHRMIIFGFDGERVWAVPFNLVAQGPDHLGMAGVATLADIDVAACDFGGGVAPHARRVFDGLMDCEQRDNLARAADAGHAYDGEQKADGLALEPIMQVEHARSLRWLRRGSACERWNGTIGQPLVGRLIRRPYGHPDVVASD